MKKLFSSARGRFIACVAVSNLLAGLLSLFVWAPLSAHILPSEHPLAPWVPMLLAILLALPVSGFVSRLSARPLQQMLHATQAVARGDYTVRVDETAGGELGELLRSFNRMTAELGSTDLDAFMYTLTFLCNTLALPITSMLGNKRGRKYIIVAGVLVYGVSSLLAGLAGNLLFDVLLDSGVGEWTAEGACAFFGVVL